MTALAEPRVPLRTPLDFLRSVRDHVTNWADAQEAGQAVAELLQSELGRPAVTLLRLEPSSGELLVLGAAPRSSRRMTPGSRCKPEGVLGSSLRQGSSQRSPNYYVEPDFVRSLPGE